MRLGNIAKERRETCKGDKRGIRLVGLEHLISGELRFADFEVDTENTFSKVFHKGDILFGRRRAYLKKAAIAEFDGICSGDITVIEAIPSKVCPDLLPFIIQNNSLFDFAVSRSAGGLSPRVKWEHLADYEFELPSIEEQRVLADKLWAAYNLKEAYKKMIAATDEMVKSQFIEMFGDCEQIRLGDVATYINGSAFKPDDWGSKGLPIIRIQNLTDNTAAYNYYNGSIDKKVVINNGDVLISWSATLGVFLWNNGQAILNQHIFKVEFNKKPIEKEFFMFAVQSKLGEMDDVTHGSTMRHIVKKDFDNTTIPYPQKEIQRQFVSITQQADKSKSELRQAIDKIDKVIKSLLQ